MAVLASLIGKERSLVECDSICTDYCIVPLEFQWELVLPINSESNFVFTLLKKYYLSILIQLLEQEDVGIKLDWLETFEDIKHELIVLIITPNIPCMFVSVVFWDREECISKPRQKTPVEELCENLADEVFWDLHDYVLELVINNCIILVA